MPKCLHKRVRDCSQHSCAHDVCVDCGMHDPPPYRRVHARDHSTPIELSRGEVLGIAFERLISIQECIEECETAREGWDSSRRIEDIWQSITEMKAHVSRAAEVVESLLEPVEGTEA